MDNQTVIGSNSSPTILLIEDDPLLVNLYKEKFENEGFNLLIAEDGEKGLKLALQEKFDIIILDLLLPKLSGIALLTQLRSDPKGKDLPVIVLTNLNEVEETKKAIELGAKEFLVKADLTPSQLVEKINTHLNRI
ncbi:hypothetical protein A2Z22_05100 [Candidatus Woesebacteria bacterium RBG_16_34_12]|uniref:Response regulatory domain-containing protein n=1 Tax=Candidatus Woesebacteria bacterium RBG_16_34_12 TaxID=1802480 RepID=A0A1F7XA86_9BACT|nr:MAG: hypothetical protein A2Z22_05100 [Candidatus Woesebacteria bacterium RBG_16_34_12]